MSTTSHSTGAVPPNTERRRSAEDIERDLDATRAQLDRTLDALQSKLSPQQRIAAGADSVRGYGSRLAQATADRLSPSITTMIRMDHTHALAVFRRFRPGVSPDRKRALVANVCLALEIHAQLEEEIFYPALQKVAGSSETLEKSVPEHDEMRALIDSLRAMEPDDARYEETFFALMRAVLHHVADEESTLLPQAEELMSDQLRALGMEMTKRRMELLRPHLAEVATSTARSFPIATAAVAVGLLLVSWLIIRPRASD
jgi:hemerythrin superfamily protein